MMLLDRSIGIISTLILARLLFPADFGIVAMCMSVIAALQVFTAFGFDVVLIQNQNSTRDHYDTVFTLNLLLGVGTSIAIAAAAGLTATYYSEPRIVLPMMVLAFGVFCRSFENVKVVDFRKDLEFKKEAILRVSQKLSGFVVTIPLAFYLQTYWAMIFGMLFMWIFSVLLSYYMKPYLPRFSLSKLKEIFSFSSWLLVNNLMIFIEYRFADFFVGRRLGAGPLGVLNMSVEIAATPATSLVAAANRAIYPGYAKLVDDKVELVRTYLSVVCGISVVAVPIGLGIAAISDLIVPILLGDKWVEATPLLAILGVFSAVGALISNTTYIFYALAVPRQLTYFQLIHILVLIPLMYYFVGNTGIVGAAWAMLAANCVSLPVIVLMASRHVPVGLWMFLGQVWRSVTAGAIMYFAVRQFVHLDLTLPEGFLMILAILIGAMVYGAALMLLILTTGFRSTEEWKFVNNAAAMIVQKTKFSN